VRPLIFVWPYALPFWVIYFWAFWPEFGILVRARKADRATRQSQDARSLQVIAVGQWIGLLLAFPLARVERFEFPADGRVAALLMGIALLAGGSLLRRHCWRTLGKFFTGNVQTVTGQTVIDRGAYRYVRHPSYTGGIMMFAGIGVALGSWLSAAITLIAATAVYLYRVSIEERALAAGIGQPYVEYMQRTKRFVPFIV
jgi:protein-S-isoprenylcysteine O-methyltransferase Ste14